MQGVCRLGCMEAGARIRASICRAKAASASSSAPRIFFRRDLGGGEGKVRMDARESGADRPFASHVGQGDLFQRPNGRRRRASSSAGSEF